MSLQNGELSAADVAAVTGANNNGWNGDGSFWIVILFLFALMGGYGNGWGGNGGAMPWMMSGMNTNNDVQRGFDQQAVMAGINGLTSAVSGGFANAEVSRCNGMTNILQAMNNNQANLQTQLNTIAMNQQNCCCNNLAAIKDVSYQIATENCADRAAVADALKDVIASNTANTQAILDKMCQQEIDALKTQNENLRTQLNMANLAASQTAQTAQILQDNSAQTALLRQVIAPTPVPAYIVAQPYNYGNNGCGCGM